MGAVWTTRTSSPGVSYRGRNPTQAPESRHVLGTTRMGSDPATSVVDAFGRMHGVENLVIADSSVFATGSGYGPTLTLVALAARAAGDLAGISPNV